MPTLDWLNRAAAVNIAEHVPYRLLEQVSVHASLLPRPVGEGRGEGSHDNLLIQGDNLEALKALLPFYRGQVKCIFIDPPLQHAERVRALRRQPGACPVAQHDVAAPAKGD